MNQWRIGARGERIVFLSPLPQSFTRTEAYNLAAWLVAMSGADERRLRDELRRILNNEDTIDEAPPKPREADRRCPCCWLPVDPNEGSTLQNGWYFHVDCWDHIQSVLAAATVAPAGLCLYCKGPVAKGSHVVGTTRGLYHHKCWIEEGNKEHERQDQAHQAENPEPIKPTGEPESTSDR